MSYCTPQDIIELYSEDEAISATNWEDPDASAVNTPRLQKHCDMATGMIDIVLMRRFQLPIDFEAIPQAEEALKAIAATFVRSSLNPNEETLAATEAAREALEGLVDNDALVEMANGRRTLEAATPGIQAGETQFPAIRFGVAAPRWTERNVGGLF
ncbi:MAG: phage protein Gp36 family protein [Cyanobacteria bacterium J06638_22]